MLSHQVTADSPLSLQLIRIFWANGNPDAGSRILCHFAAAGKIPPPVLQNKFPANAFLCF